MRKSAVKEIPQGYKNSPLGIIPNEWEVKRLGEISQMFSGGTPKSTEQMYFNGEIPFIKSGEISNAKTEQYLSELGLKNSSAKLIERGDLLYALYGATSGECALSKISGAINQAILCIRPTKDVDRYFLLSFLQKGKEYYYNSYLQGGQGNLSADIVKGYKILTPPLPEQRKIAEVLSTWDRAIEKQMLLVEKLELRKKGLMQQLLTGKKRLHGFSEEWKTVKLGSIADVVGGGTPDTNNSDYWDGNIAWLTPSEIGTEKYVYTSKKHITEEGLKNSSARLLPVGTIVFTSRATIGLKAILKTEASTNQGFQSLIISQSSNIEFVYYLLDILIHVIRKKSSGSTFPEISANSLKSINITTPPLEEQNAIAEILSVCDNEITLAKQKLDTLRQQKKGLMQVLLTGKKRVEL